MGPAQDVLAPRHRRHLRPRDEAPLRPLGCSAGADAILAYGAPGADHDSVAEEIVACAGPPMTGDAEYRRPVRFGIESPEMLPSPPRESAEDDRPRRGLIGRRTGRPVRPASLAAPRSRPFPRC